VRRFNLNPAVEAPLAPVCRSLAVTSNCSADHLLGDKRLSGKCLRLLAMRHAMADQVPDLG
jgi:hypothetical protein